MKGRKGQRMSCDVSEATEGLQNEEALLIFQPFRRFSYVTAHSPHQTTLPSLHLRHRSLSNPSVASPTSQLILLIRQPFRRFTYVTTCSPTLLSLHLCHMHFTYVTWRAAHQLDPPRTKFQIRHCVTHVSSEYGYNAAMPCSFTCVREADLFKQKFINSFELVEYI